MDRARLAHVTAKLVRESGGTADQKAELTALLKGLLPEFATIKTILHQNAALTFRGAVNQLLDFARTDNILELSRVAEAASERTMCLSRTSKNKATGLRGLP